MWSFRKHTLLNVAYDFLFQLITAKREEYESSLNPYYYSSKLQMPPYGWIPVHPVLYA